MHGLREQVILAVTNLQRELEAPFVGLAFLAEVQQVELEADNLLVVKLLFQDWRQNCIVVDKHLSFRMIQHPVPLVERAGLTEHARLLDLLLEAALDDVGSVDESQVLIWPVKCQLSQLAHELLADLELRQL